MNGVQERCLELAARLRPILALLEVAANALEAIGNSQASTIDVGDASATPVDAERDDSDVTPVSTSGKGGSVKFTKPRGSGFVPGTD